MAHLFIFANSLDLCDNPSFVESSNTFEWGSWNPYLSIFVSVTLDSTHVRLFHFDDSNRPPSLDENAFVYPISIFGSDIYIEEIRQIDFLTLLSLGKLWCYYSMKVGWDNQTNNLIFLRHCRYWNVRVRQRQPRSEPDLSCCLRRMRVIYSGLSSLTNLKFWNLIWMSIIFLMCISGLSHLPVGQIFDPISAFSNLKFT